MGADAELPVPVGRAGTGELGLPVRRVALDAPWEWFGRGWRDLCAIPYLSMAYGAFFTIGAWAIFMGLGLLEAQSLILVFAGGFVLVGPLLAAGLYEASRCLEKGERVTLRRILDGVSPAIGRLGFFGVALFVAFFFWVQLAFLLLMLFLGTAAVPASSEFVTTLLFTTAGLGLLFTGTLTGALLAAIVFSISTVAVPLLLVKDIDAVTAMVTSVKAVSLNTGPMLLWAALIAGFMALGLATLFVGLAIAFPLVGHATWHAFRALVDVSVD
jgi:uncharacterized membrane protein